MNNVQGIMLRIKWQYTVKRVPDNENLIDFLNENGKDEWELVNIIPTHLGVFCVFKRPILFHTDASEGISEDFVTIPASEYERLKQYEKECLKDELERQRVECEIVDNAIKEEKK